MIEAYPLTWPPGWPRADRQTRSQFQITHGESVRHLLNELRLFGAHDVIISSNLTLRRDGLPYSSQREPDDAGVAVYFKWNGEDQCIPCDKWNYTKDNIRAIGKTIEALRGLERWGAKEIVNAAFRGFKALPAGTAGPSMAWHEVLGVGLGASKDEIKAAFKRLAHVHHPDKGGDSSEFQRIVNAYNQGMAQ